MLLQHSIGGFKSQACLLFIINQSGCEMPAESFLFSGTNSLDQTVLAHPIFVLLPHAFIVTMKNRIRAACGVRQPCMKIRQKPGFDAHQMIRLYSLSSQVSTASADTLLLFVNYTINYENIYYTNNSELLVIWMDMFLFYRINPP
ncbi:hypothetical protein NC652_009804 [Populus alba x Populus x berolinensis]|nr:hypothetical protein NC652_009804 [Populus alba x Populus x berolinensis]